MRLAGLLLLALLATSSVAGAANLVENAGFDDDIADWFPLVGSTIQHSAADELGSLVSGSIEIVAQNPGQQIVAAAQCIPVVAGKTYALGASARFQEAHQTTSAFVSVSWSSMANCGVLDLASPGPLPYFMSLEGVWGPSQRWATAPPGAQGARFQLLASTAVAPQDPLRVSFDNAFFLEDETCGPSSTTLCLNEGRFRVIVEWETKQGNVGFGRAVPLTDDSGYFWFFNEENVELVTKLLDACMTQFNTFWFFAAGLTDVETVIRVHDTQTDMGRVYMNPQEMAFAPIQDTDAFATCP